MDDDEEAPCCPLCLEELDATDRAVKACQCGYQVCLWCLHQIRERHNGKCPACRTPYAEENFKISELNHEAAAKEAKERAVARKERQRIEKLKEREREQERANAISQLKAKTNLKHARIMQRNLVYIIGLSLSLAREEVLKRAEMFGKFGRIAKVLVNRAHPYNADAPGGPSIAAYVLYFRDQDASNAVKAMNSAIYDGREIRCAIACTKYCDIFVRSGITDIGLQLHCGNPECMYVHEIIQSEDVLTREEVLHRQLGPPPPAHLFGGTSRRIIPPVVSAASSNIAVPPSVTPASITPSRSSGAIPINIPNPPSSSAASLSRPNANNNGNNARSSNPIIPNGLSPRSVPSTLPSIGRTTGMTSSSVPPTTSNSNNNIRRSSSPPSSPDSRKRILQNTSNPRSPHGGKNINPNSSNPQPTAASWNAHQHQSLKSFTTIHSRSPARSARPAEENTTTNRKIASILSPLRTMQPAINSPLEKVRSPPPGFERVQPKVESSATPARPPGFDQIIPAPKTEPEKSPSAMGPPPGFGLPSFLQNKKKNNEPFQSANNPIHPSMTWSKEASTDKVVTPHELMKSRTPIPPVGTIGSLAATSTTPPAHGIEKEKMSSNGNPPGFVDVLGRIGGSLGVSSEVNLNPYSTGASASNRLFPLGNNNTNTSSSFGDLLSQGNQPGKNLSDPSNTYPAPKLQPQTNMNSMFAAASPFGDPATLLNLNLSRAPSKRSNSRFGFARESSGHSSHSANSNTQSAHSNSNSNSNSFGSNNAPTSWIPQPRNNSGGQDVGIHLLRGEGGIYQKNEELGTALRNDVGNIGAIGSNNNNSSIHSSSGYPNTSSRLYQIQQQQQYTKTSRFDFAEPSHRPLQHAPQPIQHPPTTGIPGIPGSITAASPLPYGYTTALNLNNNNEVPSRPENNTLPSILPQVAADNNSNMNMVNKFSQMTTADKLASLFNQASWAPGALPPMPQLNNTDKPKSESQLLAAINVNNNNNEYAETAAEKEETRSNNNSRTETPLGFSKATSEQKNNNNETAEIEIEENNTISVLDDGITPVSPDVAENSSDNEITTSSCINNNNNNKNNNNTKRTRSRREKRDKKRKAAAASSNNNNNNTSPSSSSSGDNNNGRNEEGTINNILKDEKNNNMTMGELEREIEAAKTRETQLQNSLVQSERRLRTYGKTTT